MQIVVGFALRPAARSRLPRAFLYRRAVALEEADAVITSGNLNTTIAPLLLGKPVLTLPSLLEQYINARRLELTGAGLSAPVIWLWKVTQSPRLKPRR